MEASAERAALEAQGFRGVDSSVFSYLNDGAGLAVQVQPILRGLRPVYEFVMRAATLSVREPKGPQVVLVVLESRVSSDNLSRAWLDALRALRPSIAGRIGLVVLRPELSVFPDELELRDLATELLGVSSNPGARVVVRRENSTLTVLKVLVHAWLLGSSPQTKKHLGQVTGLSQPTIGHAVSTLADVLLPTSDRSVGLARFPTVAWRQHTARLALERPAFSFVDTSGEARAPAALVRRLKKLGPSGIALSGTLAATSWDPTFDLEGTPRLDLVVHAPDRRLDLSFVKKLDPALVASDGDGRPANVVIHALQRSHSLFLSGDKGGLPVADPVEVLLDLEELRLPVQADDLIKYLTASRNQELRG